MKQYLFLSVLVLVIVSGSSSFIVFDYKNKSIYIEEQMGCCERQFTWAKDTLDSWGSEKTVRIVRRENVQSSPEGQQHEVYHLIDDTLRLAKKEFIKWDDM